jgi:hypothetical protein
MSFFYLRADFFGDQATLNDSIFLQNQSITVNSENFNSPSFIMSVAKSYLATLNLGSSGTFGSNGVAGFATVELDSNGNTFDLANLYLSCGYKSGQLKCVSANATSTIGNVELKPQFLRRYSFLGSEAQLVYTVDAYKNYGVIVNKAYHRMLPSGDGSSASMKSINMTTEEIAKIPTNNIYTNYSNCIVLNFEVYPEGEEGAVYYNNLIIIEDKNLDYLEDFSDKFYYDAGTQRYYLDSSLTECSIKVFDYFHPYILLVSSDGWLSKSVFHGPASLQLETRNDTTLDDASAEISYGYANICDSSTTVAVNNTISCTSNEGEVSVNVGGVIKLFDDQQICPIGGTAKTVIAVFSLKPLEKLTLYKDFTAITTVKTDIWGYNFRYIKYYDGSTYYSFKDNGSVASATISYLDQTLDLSKYFNIKEISDGLTLTDSGQVVAITMGFRIFRVAETDSDATSYFIDIPVDILPPEIVSIDEDTQAKQIIIKTNYATRLTYGFNQEADSSISVTDTADGTNQITTISSNGKFGYFHCKAFNYYYDLGGASRALYATEEKTLELIRNITIPSFTLTVKIGGVTKTIYDENRNSSTSLPFTDLSQDQIANYFVYSDYLTDTGSYSFIIAYSLAATKYSSMFLKLGNNPTLYPMILSSGTASFVISKKSLFEYLDNENKITLSFLADGDTPFNFPFTFLNTSQANSPVCNAFSLSRVQLSYPKASIGFTLQYTYADEVEYSVIDQDDNVLHNILIKEKFRDIQSYFLLGSTRERVVQINDLTIPESATSLRVSATVRNLYSAANPIKIEDAEVSSPTYSLPLKISAAEVILYSDASLTTEITEIVKGEYFWAFLQIKDINDTVVPVVNYSSYIAGGYKPEIFILESRGDENNDLEGVISERVDNYTFKFKINKGSKFNDTNAVFQAQYIPTIDPEIV